MRAVQVSEFGPPEVLVPVDVPDPVAETGQALIDVEIANITFVETQLRAAFGLASGTFTDISEANAARREVTVIRRMRLEPERLRELSRAALAEAEAGRLRPLIGQTFPLERAADAHAAIEARATVGKTLLLANPR